MIHLDANAGLPVHPRVAEALTAWLHDGPHSNAQSVHQLGRQSRRILDLAIESLAHRLGATPDELIVCGSGTDAIVRAIRALNQDAKTWVSTEVEHSATLRALPKFTSLPLSTDGVPMALPNFLADAGSLIWVNNETGAVTPLESITTSGAARRWHVDACQAWGKIPVDCGWLRSIGVQLASFSGHKIGTPTGIGLLWVSREASKDVREVCRRALGSPNVLGALALSVASAELAPDESEKFLRPISIQMEATLKAVGGRINAEGARRAPGSISVTFPDLLPQELIIRCDLEGVAVSAGSACNSASVEPSHVLLAMGRSREEALSTIRISFHRRQSASELEEGLQRIVRAVQGLRRNTQRGESS